MDLVFLLSGSDYIPEKPWITLDFCFLVSNKGKRNRELLWIFKGPDAHKHKSPCGPWGIQTFSDGKD